MKPIMTHLTKKYFVLYNTHKGYFFCWRGIRRSVIVAFAETLYSGIRSYRDLEPNRREPVNILEPESSFQVLKN